MATWTDLYGNSKSLRNGTIVEFGGRDWKIFESFPRRNTFNIVIADEYKASDQWMHSFRYSEIKTITREQIESGVAKFRGKGSSKKAAVKTTSKEIWVF